MYDAKWKARVRRKMLKWFDASQRDLPWRNNKTPYRVWISEIMLQQTQVATVIDYYKRFIKRFPTVKKLAAADESEVLTYWEGLGYYRRARQLHAASKIVMEKHGGKFPETFDDVLALPGIGRYTAGAVLSISLDQVHPILEGNTIRLFARLLEMKSDPRSSPNQKVLWEFSQSLLPRKRCGDFNQSLMELGSEVCHPKNPKCNACPLLNECPTAIKGLQDSVPVAAKKIKYESVNDAVVLIERDGNFLVRQYAASELWAGLWDFPRFRFDDAGGESQESQLVKLVRSQTGLKVALEKTSLEIKHAVTRYRITLSCFRANDVVGKLNCKLAGFVWKPESEIVGLPMSVTGKKIAVWLGADE